ncbi:Leukemia inhibitory factor receptor [Dirofilaria immitis]
MYWEVKLQGNDYILLASNGSSPLLITDNATVMQISSLQFTGIIDSKVFLRWKFDENFFCDESLMEFYSEEYLKTCKLLNQVKDCCRTKSKGQLEENETGKGARQVYTKKKRLIFKEW